METLHLNDGNDLRSWSEISPEQSHILSHVPSQKKKHRTFNLFSLTSWKFWILSRHLSAAKCHDCHDAQFCTTAQCKKKKSCALVHWASWFQWKRGTFWHIILHDKQDLNTNVTQNCKLSVPLSGIRGINFEVKCHRDCFGSESVLASCLSQWLFIYGHLTDCQGKMLRYQHIFGQPLGCIIVIYYHKKHPTKIWMFWLGGCSMVPLPRHETTTHVSFLSSHKNVGNYFKR